MKYLSTMILIAFVMLFTSEAKAQVPPKQPPRAKMKASHREQCARILAKIGKGLKPTRENCNKLQTTRVQAEPPRKTPAKKETTCEKSVRLLEKIAKAQEALNSKLFALQAKEEDSPPRKKSAEPDSTEPDPKAKEPPRDYSVGFGMIIGDKNVGAILTSEFVLFRFRRIVELGFAPKLSYMRGELDVLGNPANNDVAVSKIDFTADFMVKICPFKYFHTGMHFGMGLRSLTNGDVALTQDANKTVHGVSSGSHFNFLISLAIVMDFNLTKSLRMSVFYRHTFSINQILFFSVDGPPEKASAYHDNVGGLLFSILIP